MSADDQDGGPSYLSVRDAIEGEMESRRAACALKYGPRAMAGFSAEAERTRITELIANSIARGATAVFQRKEAAPEVGGFDGVEPVDLRADLELVAWLAGLRGNLADDLLGDARPGSELRPRRKTYFASANDGWLWWLVESPVDWAIIRGERSGPAERGLHPVSVESYEKVIAALMLETGKFPESRKRSWTAELKRIVEESGVGLGETVVRRVLGGTGSDGGAGKVLLAAINERSKKSA